MKRCPNCGNLSESKFCPECGTDLSAIEEIQRCPKCGTESNSKFCPECGTEMKTYSEAMDGNAEDKTPDDSIDVVTLPSQDSKIASPINQELSTVPKSDQVSKKAGKKKLIMIIGAVVAAVLILFIGIGIGGSSNTDTTTTPEETPTETTTEEPEQETTVEEPEEEETFDYFSLFGEFTKKDDYKDLNYDNLARNPDKYEGKKYKGSGKVLQVLESDTEVDLRVAVNENYDTVIYLSFSPEIIDSRILEDDYVTFYGESKGLYSYESTMGGTITIPMMYVQKISRD